MLERNKHIRNSVMGMGISMLSFFGFTTVSLKKDGPQPLFQDFTLEKFTVEHGIILSFITMMACAVLFVVVAQPSKEN